MRGNTATDPLYLQHIYFAFRLVLKVQFQGGSICVELTINPFVDEIFIYIKYADSTIVLINGCTFNSGFRICKSELLLIEMCQKDVKIIGSVLPNRRRIVQQSKC